MTIRAALLLVCAATAWSAPARAQSCHSNFLIVLDRSCSMKQVPPGDTDSKWVAAKKAIEHLVSTYGAQIDFGLVMFPDGTSKTAGTCGETGPISVPISADAGTSITDVLEARTPGDACSTPMLQGLEEAATEPHVASAYTGTGDRTYALLITDGEPSCGATSAQIADQVSMLYQKGYATFVVGFGGDVNAALLTQAAIAGGVPQAGATDGGIGDAGTSYYYQADNAAALDAELQSIVGGITGEFGGCNGTPCPDGRCFVAGQQCIGGSCLTPVDLAGDSVDASATPIGDGGTGVGGGTKGGCGCDVGGAPSTPGWPLAGIVALLSVIAIRSTRRASRG